jgi:hypothetical protein
MGINYFEAKAMWDARRRGVSFEKTLTVAHLSLHLLPAELRSLRRAYQTTNPDSTATPLDGYMAGSYSDDFIRGFLGARTLEVMDYSPYEGATIVHDLNQPVPAQYCGQFDAVIDGGSLEHVFNFPVAISNLMKMLKVGGQMFLKSPANNLCGHGFYQFSPELMFRVFTSENGFTLQRVVVLEITFPSEETAYRDAYEVTDPKQAQARVGLTSRKPALLLVEATKIADVVPFTTPPLQSDYVSAWNKGPAERAQPGALRRLYAKLPSAVQARMRGYRQLGRDALSNRGFYRKLPR